MSLPPNLKELLGRVREVVVAESAAALNAAESLEEETMGKSRHPNFLSQNSNQTPNSNALCKIHGCADPLDGLFSAYC
jgi:hypothetical protein